MEAKPVVLISGFGPFGKHTVNASWASINHMNVEELEKNNDIKIVQVEIPVVYEIVDDVIPSLWKKYNPKLVIHVGVSANATKMTLEKIAHGANYTRLDCNGVCPSSNQCLEEEINKMECKMDVDKLCGDYNKKNHNIMSCVSTEAGRYLCEYTFYSSLKIDSSRTLFVHVPDISESFTVQDIAKGLEYIIELSLNQLKNCGC